MVNFKKLIPATKEDLQEVPDSSGTSLMKFGASAGKDILAFVRSKDGTVVRSVKLMELDAKKYTKKFKVSVLPSFFF